MTTATTGYTTMSRPNRYAANCVRCRARIEPDAGLLARYDDGKWAADHDGPCPDKPAAAAMPVKRITRDGMYRDDAGQVWKVQIAHHGSGNLYAKLLTIDLTDPTRPKGHFEYRPGAINRLRDDQRMTPEAAAEFGALYGFCCICGATLTDDSEGGSIARGIGPVCGAKYAA